MVVDFPLASTSTGGASLVEEVLVLLDEARVVAVDAVGSPSRGGAGASEEEFRGCCDCCWESS